MTIINTNGNIDQLNDWSLASQQRFEIAVAAEFYVQS